MSKLHDAVFITSSHSEHLSEFGEHFKAIFHLTILVNISLADFPFSFNSVLLSDVLRLAMRPMTSEVSLLHAYKI